MNVLFIAPFPPLPECSGSRMRAMTLLRSLVGQRLFLAAFCGADEPIDEPGLRDMFAEVHIFTRPKTGAFKWLANHFSLKPLLARRFFTGAARKEIRRIVVEKQIDLVICETLLMAEYLRGLPCTWRLLDEHNLEFIRAARRIATARNSFKKLYYSLIMKRLRLYELKAVNAVDVCLTCSAEDAATIGRWCLKPRITIVPNTVDTEHFQPGANRRHSLRIVFTGTMWYEPNVDAMRYFCREVLPLIRRKMPGTTLVIAGDNPVPEILQLGHEVGITVTGYVADIRPILADASVFVAPLRMGSGTRLKILSAMAMGIPVVSTSIGAEGIAAQDGLNIRIADDPGAFAAATVALLGDPVSRGKLAEGGRKLVLENYSCHAVEQQLRRLWLEIGREAKRHV